MKSLLKFLLFGSALINLSYGAELQKVSVSYVPNLAFTQLFVIKQEGWDKEVGLDFNPARFPDASVCIQAYNHGDIDQCYQTNLQ